MIKIHNPYHLEIQEMAHLYGTSIVDILSKGYENLEESLKEKADFHLLVENKSSLVTMHLKNDVLSVMHWSLLYSPGTSDNEKKFRASSTQAVDLSMQTEPVLNSTAIDCTSLDFAVENIASTLSINIKAHTIAQKVYPWINSVLNEIPYEIKLLYQNQGLKYKLNEQIKKTNPELDLNYPVQGSFCLNYLSKNQEFTATSNILLSEHSVHLRLKVTSAIIDAQELIFDTEINLDNLDNQKSFLENSITSSVYSFFEF